MITRVAIKDYRVLGDVDIPLQPFTMLVGPNGCGKSTLMQALHATHEAEHNGRKWREAVRATFEARSRNPNILEHEPPIILTLEHLWLGPPIQYVDGVATLSEYQGAQVAPRLRRSLYLQLLPTRLSEMSKIMSTSPEFDSSGYGLATELTYVGACSSAARNQIVEWMRELIDSFEDYRILRVQVGGEYLDALQIVLSGGERVHAPLVSEGTLTVLALLTALQREKDNAVFLLEDIDKGLHPSAQMALVAILKQLVTERQRVGKPIQIIASTHSPFALRGLPPEAIIAMALGEDGKTRALPLSEHPEWPQWKDMMRPDEFWTMADPQWPAQTAK